MRNIQWLLRALDDLKIYYPVPLIWNKGKFNISWNRYHPDYELIVYAGPGSIPTGKNSRWYGPNNERCIWEISPDNSSEYLHPTQKPQELIKRALQNSSIEGHTVLDLFGGSGATLIVAEHMNRKARVMELDPYYCSVIIDRWEQFTKKKAKKL